MDILVLLKIIIRRWIVVIPVAAIVAATGYNTLSSIQPKYKGAADVMLLGPTQSVDPTTGKVTSINPFVDIKGGLNTTGVIFQTIVGDGPHHETLAKQNLSLDYGVSVNERGAPIMSVSAVAETPEKADATVAAVVNSISSELKINQDAVKVPNDTRITARLLTVSQAYQLAGDQTRVAAAIGAVGVAAIVGAALLAESLASSRALRRGKRQDAELAALLAYPAGSSVAQHPAADGTPAVPAQSTRARTAENGGNGANGANGGSRSKAGDGHGNEDADAAPAGRKGSRRSGRRLAGAPVEPPASER